MLKTLGIGFLCAVSFQIILVFYFLVNHRKKERKNRIQKNLEQKSTNRKKYFLWKFSDTKEKGYFLYLFQPTILCNTKKETIWFWAEKEKDRKRFLRNRTINLFLLIDVYCVRTNLQKRFCIVGFSRCIGCYEYTNLAGYPGSRIFRF